MELLTDIVTVFGQNRTRAELYGLWLEGCEVRTATTRSEAADVIDGSTAVAIIDRGFGGDGPKLLEPLRKRAPHCRAVVTRDRSEGFPGVDPEYHLVTPVFEEDLQAIVERLLGQVNYRLALVEYYRATGELASKEFVADRAEGDSVRDDPDGDEAAELRRRVARLRRLLTEYRKRLDGEDVAAVMESVTFQSAPESTDSAEESASKHHPGSCSNCGRDWSVSESDPERAGFRQLGARVWRCIDCGHVQMRPDPSHQRVSPYER